MKIKLNALGLLIILLIGLISCRFINCNLSLKEGLAEKKSETNKMSLDGGLRNPIVPSYGQTEIKPAQTMEEYMKKRNESIDIDDRINENVRINNNAISALPKGIKRNEIPKGQEDLYILKSEVIPPVCPACPQVNTESMKKEKCPPCPACARCPEPSFECKKVPNFRSNNNPYLPKPVLNDFSQFGM